MQKKCFTTIKLTIIVHIGGGWTRRRVQIARIAGRHCAHQALRVVVVREPVPQTPADKHIVCVRVLLERRRVRRDGPAASRLGTFGQFRTRRVEVANVAQALGRIALLIVRKSSVSVPARRQVRRAAVGLVFDAVGIETAVEAPSAAAIELGVSGGVYLHDGRTT